MAHRKTQLAPPCAFSHSTIRSGCASNCPARAPEKVPWYPMKGTMVMGNTSHTLSQIVGPNKQSINKLYQ